MKTKAIRHAAWMILASALLSACQSEEPDGPSKVAFPKQDIELEPKTWDAAKTLYDFYTRFTFDMTEYIDSQGDDVDKNVIVSPLSAAMTFAMAANAADEETRKGYADYLGVSDLDALNDLSKVLLDQLPKVDNSSVFSLSNSVWVNSGMNLKSNNDYNNLVKSDYKAEIFHRDFIKDNAGTLKALNDWCSSHTKNGITSHFKEIDSDLLAIFLNALYFRGQWKDEIFDSSKTVSDTFHGLNGDSNVMMMKSYSYHTVYAYDGEFDFVRLDFGNGAYFIYIIVPAHSNSTAKLDAERLSALQSKNKYYSVKVYLPKFSIKCNNDLSKMLASINRDNLLNPSLTMFTTPEEGVLNYRQTAGLSVDESGAVVETVTSGGLSPSAPFLDGAIVRVDRPFYFFIREESTGSCILSGRIANL